MSGSLSGKIPDYNVSYKRTAFQETESFQGLVKERYPGLDRVLDAYKRVLEGHVLDCERLVHAEIDARWQAGFATGLCTAYLLLKKQIAKNKEEEV